MHMKYIRKVLACLRKADEKYALIDENDKIVLGISGGKDSLCLLKAMSIYGKFANKKFSIYPICLDLGFPGFDGTKLKGCKFGPRIKNCRLQGSLPHFEAAPKRRRTFALFNMRENEKSRD